MTTNHASPIMSYDDLPESMKSTPSRDGQVLVHILGAVATIGALVAGGVLAGMIGFLHSYCGDGASADEIHDLQHSLRVLSLLVAAVPATVGVAAIFTRVRLSCLPWFIVAGLVFLATSGSAAAAQPGHWCAM